MTKDLMTLVCISLSLIPLYGQTINNDLKKFEQAYLDNPETYQHHQNLQWLLASKFEDLLKDQRGRIRSLLSKSTFSTIALCPISEPGKRIVIKGRVTDGAGPIKAARVIVFQTDNSGSYAPADAQSKRMSESDARLYGVLLTNEKGEYELQTIHPGTYPFKVDNRYIPQHIHFNITAEGFKPLSVQMAFEDDPAMKDDHWQQWAKDLNFPILKLSLVDGISRGNCNFVLKK